MAYECNFTYNSTAPCEVNTTMYTIAFLPFKFLSIIINLTLFCAAIHDRKRLRRQNYTYLCVISSLLSNFVYLLLSVWLTVDNYAQDKRDSQENEMTGAKYLWIFSEAFTVAMVFGICANVTSLIYVTLDSVYYVGRSGTEWGSSPRNSDKVNTSGKQRVARVLVAVSWIVPVILTVISFWWNCAKICRCPSNNFEGEHCPINDTCSRMWAPLKKQFLVVVVAVWLLQITVLVVGVVKGIKKHNQALETPPEPTTNRESAGNLEGSGSCALKEPTKIKTVTSYTNNNEEVPAPPIHRRKSAFQRKFNFRLKFAIIMTCLIVVATTPGTISLIVDASVRCVEVTPLILTSAVFLYVYVTLCPLLMWKFLPNLRSSMQNLWSSVTGCTCLKSRAHKKARNTQKTAPSE